MINRLQHLVHRGNESCFLWGPRQCGKSTLLKSLFPQSRYYNLLHSEEFERLNHSPFLIRQEVVSLAKKELPIIIDEVQRVPALLDEVHGLIAEHQLPFILCGSSARKLKRGGGNLLGGRALRYELFPLVSHEIPHFDLARALNRGLLPRHYLGEDPRRMAAAYIGDYLKEEIAAEALSRNIPAFGRFLEASGFSNGEILNYQNIASECGVSSPTVKEYFQILVDTLIGRFVPSFQKRPKRRVIQTPKFYFFDVGIVNFLLKRGEIFPKSEAFGRAFKHFIYQEIAAHSHYSGLDYSINYWRTASQIEVDFILGGEVAIEIKSTAQTTPQHLRGLLSFREEYKPRLCVVVSLDPHPRDAGGIKILPWKIFLEKLWGGEIVK